MKQITLIASLLITLLPIAATAQSVIKLDCPKLGNREAWVYYFSGSKVDSVSVMLDDKGTAKMTFPQKDYRGMAYFYIPEAGGSEFVLAEPTLHIACDEEGFTGTTLQFPQSKENDYLRNIFSSRNYLMRQQEWLQSGEQFLENEEDKAFSASLSAMLQENAQAVQALDRKLPTSPFYAARLMEMNLFMGKLYEAVQSADISKQQIVQNEIEYKLDINALYHSGNLWNDVHIYYGGLFVQGESNDANDKAYAASVEKTLMRLQEPVRTAFFVAAATAADRNNRQFAIEYMVKDFLRNYPDTKVEDAKLQRILNAYRVEKGNIAPALSGLSKPIEQATILIFFDSNCDHCQHELDWLTEHYAEVQAKGYRIISIAADTEQNNYLNAAAAFTWDKADRLCDFKGFDGENFKNYSIIGTPSIFEVDKNGVIKGRYAQMKEVF